MKNKTRKQSQNKKAGIFAAGMILAVIIFMAAAWFAFNTTNNKIKAEIQTLSILNNFNNEQVKFSFYAHDSQKLAASQAFYELAKEAAIDPLSDSCYIKETYFIWSEHCHPQTDQVTRLFLNKYNQTFSKLIRDYPNKNISADFANIIEGDKLTSTSLPIILEEKKKATFATYTITQDISPKPPLQTDLVGEKIYLDNFENIYNGVLSRKSSCSIINEACFEDLGFAHWNDKVEDKGAYLLFTLTTKETHFFQEGNALVYKPIVLNFVIEK